MPGDLDPDKRIIAESSKLIGNSVYGHTLMDKSRHTSVKFCNLDEAVKLVNDPFFRDLDEFDEETFEVSYFQITKLYKYRNKYPQ